MRRTGTVGLFVLLSLSIGVLQFCNTPSSTENQNTYLNHSDSAAYVGMSVCAQCHVDKVESFSQTGMGLSFDSASRAKSSARFEAHHLLYDSVLNFYYKPYWADEKLMLQEFRLEGKDTVYSRTEEITHIIGSGQHTNSHLIRKGMFMVQAPFTWYAQDGKLDFPPGFENGNNSRFSRVIDQECMTCHNAMPTMVGNSTNAFEYVPHGIDCERCHGPGSIHVNYRRSGQNPGNDIDYTIVNPSNLNWERQIDVCQRCHLQGNNILKPGKTFADFKPGMVLSDVFEIFLPDYGGSEGQFNMANHSDRFQSSKCFSNTADFTCISCHNPHISVKATNHAVFNQSCSKCHGTADCREKADMREAQSNDCVHCHMPSVGTEDIPHVSVHEHKIGIYSKGYNPTQHKSQPIGLYSVNGKNTDDYTMAKAYLTYYEKFDQLPVYRQKADAILKKSSFPDLDIHYAYQVRDWLTIKSIVSKGFDNPDAYTCYRIAKAFENLKDFPKAAEWLELAISKDESNYKFLSDLGGIYIKSQNTSKALESLRKGERLFPEYGPLLNNLGYLYIVTGQPSAAKNYLTRSLELNPDNELSLENLVLLYSIHGPVEKERYYLELLLKVNPKHEIAQKRYSQLSGGQ